MTQEEQATVLARWLSGPPGTPPPTELDPEVVESVYALRPDLAPAAELDLDELLGSVTTGPLASAEARASAPVGGGGEVVPFPSASRDDGVGDAGTRAAPSRGWARWATVAVGGTSGLGLLVAAAAVLLFVALPNQGPLDAGAPAAREVAAEPTAATAPAPTPAAEREGDAAPETITARASAGPREEATRTRDASAPADDAPAAVPMQSGVVYRDPSTIPELQAGAERQDTVEDAVADLDALEQAPVADEVASAPARPSAEPAAAASKPAAAKADKEASDPRSAAVPRDLAANGWRRGLDKATQQVFDAALTEAEASIRGGDARGGAERLAAAVGAPARAGQHVAARAATTYLQAGDPAAAAAVARRGLALSSENTPERSALLVALGDALRAQGDGAGAAEAWQQAAAGNAAR
jgi:HAMP domain-containing protein